MDTKVLKVILYLVALLLSLLLLFLVKKESFLVMTFIIVIISLNLYLIVDYYKSQKNESFTDIADMVNQLKLFQNNLLPTTDEAALAAGQVSAADAEKIKKSIEDLNTNFNLILQSVVDLSENKNASAMQTANFNNISNIYTDLEGVKSVQLSKLRDLQEQLIKTSQLITTKEIQKEANKYKPIKIYSSCIVNNADGTYST